MNKLLKLFFLFLFLSVVLAQTDTDKDGIPDSEDNSPLHWNPFQEDVDGDGIGDWSDSTTIRVSLSESFSGHIVALSSKILAALKTIHSEDRVITEVQFVSVDDIDSHLVFNTTDLT